MRLEFLMRNFHRNSDGRISSLEVARKFNRTHKEVREDIKMIKKDIDPSIEYKHFYPTSLDFSLSDEATFSMALYYNNKLRLDIATDYIKQLNEKGVG